MRLQPNDILGLYERLKRELAIAYGERPWRSGRIDRLTAEISDVERRLRTSEASSQAESRVAARLGF
jgi:hypothetical protein